MSTTDPARDRSVKISIKHRRTGEFLARHSLLTDLFQISHISCVRNAFTAALVLLIVRGVINDFVHYGRFHCTFELLHITVGQLHIVALVWCAMTLSTSCIVFFAVHTWAKHRNQSSGLSRRSYDTGWLMVYVVYLTALLVLPCWQIIKYQLPIVSATIITAEQLRQLMKTHSFVREAAGRIVQSAKDASETPFSLPSSHFYRYIYFLFAPTLLYREDYPRTPTIRWTFVRDMFGQFLIVLIFVYHVVLTFWLPIFKRMLADRERTLESAVSTMFELMMPGSLIIVLAFYGFFHCWLNGFAELLRFADRMFYEDWWNLTSAATFWRSWNVVVHDWLYAYVYKDTSRFFHVDRNIATISVVILSAIFHEYFVIVTLGLFSPVLIGWFVVFGILFRFSFPYASGSQWNIILLAFVPVCTALIPYLYVLEASPPTVSAKRTTFWNTIFFANEQSAREL